MLRHLQSAGEIEGNEFPVYSRRRVSSRKNATWNTLCKRILGWDLDMRNVQVLIDINSLVKEHGHAQLGVFKLSKDHKLLAYTLDLAGDELFTLFIKDLESGALLSETIHGVVSVEWSSCGGHFYYTSASESRRPFKVSLHKLGSDVEKDVVILQDGNPKNFVDVTKTKDWKYILVNVNSKISSEVFLIDSTGPPTTLRRVEARKDGIQYFLEHHEGDFYILTNWSREPKPSSNYRLIRCKENNLCFEESEEVVSADSRCWIEDMDIFNSHLVLYKRDNGLPAVEIMTLDREKDAIWKTLDLPASVAVLTPGANSDFNSTTLRLSVSSPVMPEETYDVDMTTCGLKLLQQVKVPDSESYIMEHHAASSHDNVQVPLTIVYSKDLQRKGENPALLIGYGAYGELLDLSFSTDRLSLLDRGWVIAFAHVRGSGALGKTWHLNGKLMSKKNSFRDFVACGQYLLEKNFSSRDRLAAWGESAGGLLVAASMNSNPELFKAVILKVPFLDILNTMLDSSLNLTEHEYDEWGNPSEERTFEYLREYSPYDNIDSKASYPSMLITASFLDTRVGYWEAAKWVAACRHLHGEARSKVLLKTDMSGGHFGPGGRYSHLRETAYDYAFLIHAVNNRL